MIPAPIMAMSQVLSVEKDEKEERTHAGIARPSMRYNIHGVYEIDGVQGIPEHMGHLSASPLHAADHLLRLQGFT